MLNSNYIKGVKHGIPIALGYLSVSFAFGISAVSYGLTPLQSLMISMFNLTSAGQLAGLTLITCRAPLLEMALTQLTINLRYSLMSITLSQNLDKSMTLMHRFLLSFAVTDEIFAVSVSQPPPIDNKYLYGISNISFLGWVIGTIIGAIAGNILPIEFIESLGIAIYGMFIAILAPSFKKAKPYRFVIVLSAILSCIFKFSPYLKNISFGFVIIICSISTAFIAAFLFPVDICNK